MCVDRTASGPLAAPSLHRLYVVTAAITFPPAARLGPAPGSACAEVRISCAGRGFPDRECEATPAFTAPPNSEGEVVFRVHRTDAGHLLRFAGVADYHVTDDRIDCHVIDPAYRPVLEIYLLGTVLSFWLERRGIPALHAAAVAIGDRAVGFLAGNRAGKTSLAAALVAGGHPLLTDDILGVDVEPGLPRARPGYPEMRMWPDQARRFLGRWAGLERVHPALEKRRVPVGSAGFGTFRDSARPLAALYLPRRRAPGPRGSIEIEPVPPDEALIELLRASFVPNVAAALGWSADRLRRLSAIVRHVPVRRLLYPDGFERLSDVADALVADTGGGEG